MEIIFNSHTRQIEPETTVQELIDRWIGEKQKGIAVAVNHTVVPKGAWPNYVLQPRDHVLVINATQGG